MLIYCYLRSSSLRDEGRADTRLVVPEVPEVTEVSLRLSRGSALARPLVNVLSDGLRTGWRSRVSVLRLGLGLTSGLAGGGWDRL